MHQALKTAVDIVRERFLERRTYVDGNAVRPLTLQTAAWQWVTHTVSSPEQGLEYFSTIVREEIVSPKDLGDLNDPQTWLEFFRDVLTLTIAAVLLREPELELENLRRREAYGE